MATNNTPHYNRRLLFSSFSLALLLILEACGSSGGSTNVRTSNINNNIAIQPPPPPAPAQTDPAIFRTVEFTTSKNLGAIGAEYAYAGGYTGNGITIGVLDFNFDFSSPEVNYATGSTGANQTYIEMIQTNLLNRLDAGHTAGRNDPAGMLWYKLGF